VLIDPAALGSTDRLQTDVCIVGAGPAGIAVAEVLEGHGVDCLVVEAGPAEGASGGRTDLGGEVSGHPYFRLDRTRATGFGGTSRLWPADDALRCRRLDAVDLVARPEIDRGGWPIEASELATFYERAEHRLGLPPIDDPGPWEAASGAARLPLPSSEVQTVMARFAPVDVFRSAFDAFRRSPRIRLLSGATAIGFVRDDHGTVDRARLLLSPTREVHVDARRFVLAAGAIETARLLLASGSGAEPALGNHHDLVGRFFMEHLHTWGATLAPSDEAWAHAPLYQRTSSPAGDAMGLLTFPERRLRDLGLPNVAVFFDAVPVGRAGPVAAAVHGLHRAISYRRWPPPTGTTARAATVARHPRAALRSANAWRGHGAPGAIDLMVMSEQLPDRSSRVTLSSRRDDWGIATARLDWRPQPRDFETLARAQHLIAAALQDAGLGSVTGFADELRPPPLSGGGYHHLGTTRMDPNPARGVVDTDGRVHGTTNLYVTGGAVFPTGGFANPTFTIVALAIRLGEHLGRRRRAPATSSVAGNAGGGSH
jgi:choline dehydrogenase-like flavoprotein